MRQFKIQADHTGMVTKNMDEAVRFYTEVMGYEVDSLKDLEASKLKCGLLSKDGHIIELLEPYNKDEMPDGKFGLKHIAYSCENLDGLHEELKNRGYTILTSPGPFSKGRFFFAADPDGAFVEFMEYMQ